MNRKTILVDAADYAAMQVKIETLEAEVRMLKRQLAARSGLPPATNPIKETGLAHLPKQDREFFERKLRGKGKP